MLSVRNICLQYLKVNYSSVLKKSLELFLLFALAFAFITVIERVDIVGTSF